MSATSDHIAGIRPIAEALAAGVPVRRILVATGRHPQLDDVVAAARAAAIPVEEVTRAELDRSAAGVRHQGVVAEVEPYRYRSLEELTATALGAATARETAGQASSRQATPPSYEAKQPPQPLVVADGISDPQNVGAMLRAIDAAGGGGLVIREHRAAGITPAARKASAGAAEHIGVARVTNIAAALEELKAAGWWVLGLDGEAPTSIYDADLSGPIALVAGAEGSGLSRLVRDRCDLLVRIPMAGRVASLNVAQSVAVALFEWRRRALGAPPGGAGKDRPAPEQPPELAGEER